MSRVTRVISRSGYQINVTACGPVNVALLTPLPTNQHDKNAKEELKLADAAITDMQMRQRDVATLLQNTRRCDAKLKMMLCVMMLPLVVVGCTSKQSVSQCIDTRLRRG